MSIAIAKADVYPLDGDDDPEDVLAMLRHMYGMRYNQHPQNRSIFPNAVEALKGYIRTYHVADKYDCPSLRNSICSLTRSRLHRMVSGNELAWQEVKFFDLMADLELRHVFVDWLADTFYTCMQLQSPKMLIKNGMFLDVQCSTRLLLKLGEKSISGPSW
ncbi:hypothetical protein E4T38_07664 [Aureobasidium subglaciale]|nr:hypothetical protein E4T38_07664 [Aureobasidium subglaciale]KAI5216867.1 hypothetical protein E4T40_07674 [Aureobasidium subglaciale]KAI5220170.1 hypothetical protein E4T41_07589 [Aureobasidium subglaciale]KAI5258190.1 hypothetical protein E4T46_07565 [Aureobasidium subglaciale]